MVIFRICNKRFDIVHTRIIVFVECNAKIRFAHRILKQKGVVFVYSAYLQLGRIVNQTSGNLYIPDRIVVVIIVCAFFVPGIYNLGNSCRCFSGIRLILRSCFGISLCVNLRAYRLAVHIHMDGRSSVLL